MAMVAFGGLETGDFSDFPFVSSASAATDIVRSGAYSVAQGTGNSSYISIPATSNAYCRVYCYFTAFAVSGEFLILSDASFNSLAVASLISDDSSHASQYVLYGLNFTSGINGALTKTITTNRWYRFDLKYTKGTGSNGIVELRLDGAVVATITTATGTTDVTYIRLINSHTTNLYFDDWYVDGAAYAPDGHCIARQGKAGTPNADAWTKTSSQTIDAVWSATPYSATNSAAATGASQAQTMLCSSFSTPQAGHGGDVIGSLDTLNAVKVAVIGKRGSTGGTTTHAVRFRYNSSNNDSADWSAITTTDAYFEYYPSGLTLTLANLNSSEAGGVQGSSASQFFTIEDLWTMVDYNPVALTAKARKTLQAIPRAAFY